jgi:hypothetical protein
MPYSNIWKYVRPRKIIKEKERTVFHENNWYIRKISKGMTSSVVRGVTEALSHDTTCMVIQLN